MAVRRIADHSMRRNEMKLTPPTTVVFWIAVALAVLGLLGQIGVVAALNPFAFWLIFIGYVVLAVSLLIKGA